MNSNDKIEKAYNLVREAQNLLNEVIWESQEGQEDHFDRLPKFERIAISGCYHSLKYSCTSLENLLSDTT